jgi:hypothetical protein
MEPKSYKVDVLAHGETKFVSNGIRLATKEEAQSYGDDLAGRWTMVREWNVVESEDPVNYRWGANGLEGIEKKN